MARLNIFFLLLSLPLLLNAQSLHPQVIATAGESTSAAGFSLSWTMGEVAIQTFSTPTFQLTEGFHQPEVSSVGIEPQILSGLSIYPNPAQGSFWIKKESEAAQEVASLELIDLVGRKVMTQELSAHQTTEQILLPPNLAESSYLIQLFNAEHKPVHTSRIWIR